MNKIVLVTGASAGFGRAIAERFASQSFNVIICGRRKERLLSLAKELQENFSARIYPLSFDLQDRSAVYQAIASLPAEWQQIDILVNNAGLALGRDYFDEADPGDWDTMIDTNIRGLLYISKAVLPQMIARKSGHIVNLGSISGKEVYEKGNVYCATKHAVDAISKSMRIDLLRYGIRVTAIHPGAAETEFSMVRFKGNQQLAEKVYEGYDPLMSEDIADAIFYCCNLPERVCINDLVITAKAQANSFYVHRELR